MRIYKVFNMLDVSPWSFRDKKWTLHAKYNLSSCIITYPVSYKFVLFVFLWEAAACWSTAPFPTEIAFTFTLGLCCRCWCALNSQCLVCTVHFALDINQPSLPTLFILFLCLFVFMAHSTVFHSINSLDSSPFSHSVLLVLFLPYLSFQLYITFV